jgi:hypothetical protein
MICKTNLLEGSVPSQVSHLVSHGFPELMNEGHELGPPGEVQGHAVQQPSGARLRRYTHVQLVQVLRAVLRGSGDRNYELLRKALELALMDDTSC